MMHTYHLIFFIILPGNFFFFQADYSILSLICLISLYMFSPLFTWVDLLSIAAIYLPFLKCHGTDLHDCILAHTFKWVKNGDRGTEHCLRWMANNACVHPDITDIKYQWLLNPPVLFCCYPHRPELFLPLSFFPVTPVGAFVFHVLCGRAYRRKRARTHAVHGCTNTRCDCYSFMCTKGQLQGPAVEN